MKFAKRVASIKPSPIRELLKLTKEPGVISFAGGWPAPESFPVEELKAVSQAVLEEKGRSALQYASTEGYDPLREFIAGRMRKNGVNDCAYTDILITSGSQQGLDFTAKLFVDDGDKIICESPSYVGALNAFRAYEPEFIDVAMDEDGMNMDELERILNLNPDAKFIYTVPDFQNPTGITMSIDKRQRLVDMAQRYGVPVVEDNPYYELRFEGEKLPPIKAFDRTGIVIYMGSFSKTFCPGLRIGWINARPDILRKYVLIKQGADLQNNTLSQMELHGFVSRYDFDEHVNRVRRIYKSRKDVMLKSMDELFPEFVSYTYPKGGMFTWVTLPEDMKAEDVFARAIEKKVAFVPGDGFFPNGGDTCHFRLNYGTMSEELIAEGIKRLAKVLSDLR